MQSVNQVRQQFIDYFASQEHRPIPSSPLVPQNDPTLLFTNAGMVQFKNVFTGTETPPSKRAVTSQKCVRAGGKHNDLDNVGYTARHHTFFEMLGNFSFGDYFKENAILYAWELLTKGYGIPKDKLGFTVYHTDDEAFNLWKKITGCPDSKILRIPTKDNFWSMGDTGPCGPCSEIFYDHGPDAAEGEWALDEHGSDKFGDRFIEIWNLVFMQFEQQLNGDQIPLPKPSIDTGMGLERISAVLQGVHDNYDIDLFRTIIRATSEFTSVPIETKVQPSFKVIADHLRSSCFLIADGVTPSNEGRGYVLRRIMRRAMRHVHHLGYKQEPLMHKLVPVLIQEMGGAYPELKRAEALLTETLRGEEERFQQTLERGLSLLEEMRDKLPSGGTLPGEEAFKLYDTYGFPVDLTADILRGSGHSLDMDAFERAMEQQRDRARANWSGSGGQATEKLWFELYEKHGATQFMGYDATRAEGTLLAIIKDGALVSDAAAGDSVQLLFDRTPFYGESGGQMGDHGTIGDDAANIENTTKPHPELILHYAKVEKPLRTGEHYHLHVDVTNRDALRANHSATHLLHSVLRRILGQHVTQQGSLVAADKLRFDFSHGKALTEEEIQQIQQEVNRLIRQNADVETQESTPQEAIEKGAMALFGEKYGDKVRVVSMGCDADEQAFSTELCGGTHVKRTGDIQLFVITGQASVAAGVRRLEAITGQAALNYLLHQRAELQAIAGTLKASSDEALMRVEQLAQERRRLEKELQQVKAKAALGGQGVSSGPQAEQVNGVSFIGQILPETPAKELKPLADAFKQKVGSGVVALISQEGGKASIVVGVTPDLATKLNAVDLVRAGSEATGGKGGGGRPDLAQAGGPDGSQAEAALQAIRQAIR